MIQQPNKDRTTTPPTGNNAKLLLVAGCYITFNSDVISESGMIIAKKGQKIKVEEVLKKQGFWGKGSGQWYDEKIYGVKLKGYSGEWLLSAFMETSTACH